MFNDKTASIEFEDPNLCLWLYDGECGQKSGRILDINPNNRDALLDLSIQSWQGIISAVEIIQCPVVNDIYVYTEPNFKGNRI